MGARCVRGLKITYGRWLLLVHLEVSLIASALCYRLIRYSRGIVGWSGSLIVLVWSIAVRLALEMVSDSATKRLSQVDVLLFVSFVLFLLEEVAQNLFDLAGC